MEKKWFCMGSNKMSGFLTWILKYRIIWRASPQKVWCVAWEFAFLSTFQVMLLAQDQVLRITGLVQHLFNRIFCDDENVLCTCCSIWYPLVIHVWVLSTWNVASAIKEWSFKFYLIFIHLNLNSNVWQVAKVLDSIRLEMVHQGSTLVSAVR